MGSAREAEGKRLRRIVQLALGNLFVFFAIVVVANVFSAVLLDLQYLLERTFLPDPKAERPTLPDRELARQTFDEFDALQTNYAPYFAWSRAEFHGETITVAADGDRKHRPRTQRPEGVVRFFGGSTMWGKGVVDEKTIPARFNDLRPELEVYNHGESGFVSRQSIARLVNLANQEEPMDWVVFYDGCNDAHSLCRGDVSINGHTREQKLSHLVAPSSYLGRSLSDATLEVVEFLRLSLGLAEVLPSRCQSDPAYAQRVARTLVNNWKIARRIAEDQGAGFLAILQPLAPIGGERSDIEVNAESVRVRDYRLVYPIVREVMAREEADWLHDFRGAFDGEDSIYIDNCHVNDRGNEVIAHRIHELIRDVEVARGELAQLPTGWP
ncbi:MAG: hypothetical protein JRH16_11830 [Deltaproteobacteria bacterium]|nr:hypothetical protein [Deltaproteobacteria bacterium]MBW2363044.1 hypothetical protein [Deltaproteobacteria bacterium]